MLFNADLPPSHCRLIHEEAARRRSDAAAAQQVASCLNKQLVYDVIKHVNLVFLRTVNDVFTGPPDLDSGPGLDPRPSGSSWVPLYVEYLTLLRPLGSEVGLVSADQQRPSELQPTCDRYS